MYAFRSLSAESHKELMKWVLIGSLSSCFFILSRSPLFCKITFGSTCGPYWVEKAETYRLHESHFMSRDSKLKPFRIVSSVP